MTSGNRKKVLITGASGLIGGLVLQGLRDKYDFSAVNRRAIVGLPCTQADISDFDAILPAFQGIDTVLHLPPTRKTSTSGKGPNA